MPLYVATIYGGYAGFLDDCDYISIYWAQRLRLEAARICQKAEERGDYRTALAGVRELTRIVELLAKLQGDLNEQSVNVVFNARWIELRSVILNTLEDFPEAKVKLSEVLKNAS